MAVWKKVIVSGSNAELLAVTASQGIVVGASSSFAGYNRIGTNQSNTVLSGSFTGSFVGEGSGLTGLVSSLNISGSDASTGTVALKTQNLTITGVGTEINTTVSGQTVTIGLVDNPEITGDITIGGNDIKSNGGTTAITLNGSDVEVKGDLQVTGNDIKSSTGATNITLTAGTLTTFAGDIKIADNTISSSTATAIELNGSDVEVRGDLQVSGNDIKSSTGATNITLTADTLTTFAGDIKIGNNTISSSTDTAIELNGTNVEVRGDLQISGNDIKSSAGNSVFTLSGADATANANLTVTGDLRVNGDLTYLNVSQLAIKDRFILLSSGSVSAGDAGLVVDFGGGSGSVFAYDSGTSRWGLTGSLNASASAYTPDAFVASVITSDIPAYQQVGNIRVEAGEIYIYV